MRQLHLHLAVAPLALACLGFRPLALGQIEHEGDALVPFSRLAAPTSTGTRLPSLRKYSFSYGLDGSGRLQLGHSPRIARRAIPAASGPSS